MCSSDLETSSTDTALATGAEAAPRIVENTLKTLEASPTAAAVVVCFTMAALSIAATAGATYAEFVLYSSAAMPATSFGNAALSTSAAAVPFALSGQ